MIFHNIMRRRGDVHADGEIDRDEACVVTPQIAQNMTIDIGATHRCSARTIGGDTQEIIADELWAAVGPAWVRELRKNREFCP
jgi:hypothetical protein